MNFVFDPYGSLHLYHYEDEDFEQRQKDKRMEEGWRQEIKEGSIIDAIKGDFKCKAWGKAKIVKIDDEDFMRIEF